jgi:hypothetical protein
VEAKDIFIGPLLRRAQSDLVVICLATFKPLALRFSVRIAGQADWLGHDSLPVNIKVSQNLYFYFGRVVPSQGRFPLDRLLAYSIGEINPLDETASYADFESIVKEDNLAYADHPLPTFFLQSATRKLNALYGSCRKIHDEQGGKTDALSIGDTLIAEAVNDLDRRPAILCLGGDQIYADDVDPTVLSEVMDLARKIEGSQQENLPNATPVPRGGMRKDFVRKKAKFTSDESDNHLVTFAEYLAMYGLMWHPSNWKNPKYLHHFTSTLPKVRRLLANIPSYMIFDDHDVTDDWNLSLKWQAAVQASDMGKRIVANALMAFWLCQGYGNDPTLYNDQLTYDLGDWIRDRHKNYALVEKAFWSLHNWEFFTPTYPFIYFLDTRTQRGPKDSFSGMDTNAPAFLKSLEAWNVTLKRLNALLSRQNPGLPLVIMSAAPVFGFQFVEELQKSISGVIGPYTFDLESWSANRAHLLLFLHLVSDKNVVLLSGDVHYAYTSTVRFSVFDSSLFRRAMRSLPPGSKLPRNPSGPLPTYELLWTARFIQLTSSALKNFASNVGTRIPANLTSMEPAAILTETGDVERGKFDGKDFQVYEVNPFNPERVFLVKKTPAELKPAHLFRQRINDAFNSRYLGDHNIGLVTIQDKTVTNTFYTAKGKEPERTWDFSNGKYWE